MGVSGSWCSCGNSGFKTMLQILWGLEGMLAALLQVLLAGLGWAGLALFYTEAGAARARRGARSAGQTARPSTPPPPRVGGASFQGEEIKSAGNEIRVAFAVFIAGGWGGSKVPFRGDFFFSPSGIVSPRLGGLGSALSPGKCPSHSMAARLPGVHI